MIDFFSQNTRQEKKMNKLLRTVKSIVIALLITGCTSIPTEDIDDRPWNDSMDMQLRGPIYGEEW